MTIDLQKFEAEITPLIAKRFSDIETYQQKCYRNNREWQLRKFHIGYTSDWSKARLIDALARKLQTLRKIALRAPGSSALIMRPMIRVAYEYEVANREAA